MALDTEIGYCAWKLGDHLKAYKCPKCCSECHDYYCKCSCGGDWKTCNLRMKPVEFLAYKLDERFLIRWERKGGR